MLSIKLSQDEIKESLTKYIEYVKLDFLAQRQVEAWKIEWEDDGCVEHADVPALQFEPTHALVGSMLIQGGGHEFLKVRLHATCWWNSSNLMYNCLASASFDKTMCSNKADRKVHDRLYQDDYISKLVLKDGISSSPALCSATIYQSSSELEERVQCDEEVGEGIRRAVFSHADSPLDVFQLLLNLPILPSQRSNLAARAKLRLLEDAMCNACEHEEEDEIVSTLRLEENKDIDDVQSSTDNKRRKKAR